MFEEIVGTSPALQMCYRAFPKLHRVILRSSSLAKQERVKSLLRALSTDDQIAVSRRIR